MQKIIAILFFSLLCLTVFGQSDNQDGSEISKCKSHLDSLIDRAVYAMPDEMPKPEGGLQTLYNEILKHIKYPSKRIGIETKVIIGFIVDNDGSIIGKRIFRNIEGTDIAKQTLDVIENIKWFPGNCENQPVPVIMILPIQIHYR